MVMQRLTVTKVVFEYSNVIKYVDFGYGLTVTKVVFEYFVMQFLRFLFMINSNKGCF